MATVKRQLLAGLAFLLLGGAGTRCTRGVPTVPDLVYVVWQDSSSARVGYQSFHPDGESISIFVDWGDGKKDTSSPHASGDTIRLSHSWSGAATSHILRARAVTARDPGRASEWSRDSLSPWTQLNDPPTPPGIYGPTNVPKGGYVIFRGRATDPDGDSVALRFNYGGSWGGWTEFVPSGGVVLDSHKFTQLGTTYVHAIAKDTKGAISAASEAIDVLVDTVGVVKWWWTTPDEHEGPPLTSPVLKVWGEDTLVCYVAEGDRPALYIINMASTRHDRKLEGCYGEAAYCAQTGHLIIGADSGLCAVTLNAWASWYWDDGRSTDLAWGAPAIIQNRIYIPRDNDSIYYFLDNGSSATLVSACHVHGILDAPVIDNAGNVIFATDSGYIYKMDGSLSAPLWHALVAANEDVYGPVIDAGGIIYVGTGSRKVVALNPADGSVKWEKEFDGEVTRIALGAANIYFGTGLGSVYAVRQTDGSEVWKQTPSQGEFLTTPVVASNGLLYIQDADDILYCMKQSDGTTVWECNCLDYGPIYGKGGGRKVDHFPGNPTICPNGDIIVVGEEALYCVDGYTAGTLASTPWPKWQHDLHNTGRVGGGW